MRALLGLMKLPQLTPVTALLLLGSSVGLAQQPQPSFECSKASTLAETAVCSDGYLSGMDHLVAEQYGRLRDRHIVELRASQRAWLKTRDACSEAKANMRGCLIDSYSNRLEELRVLTLKTDYPQSGVGHYKQIDWWWSGVHSQQLGMFETDADVCAAALEELNAEPRPSYYICSVPFDVSGQFTRPAWVVVDPKQNAAFAWKLESLRRGKWADETYFSKELDQGHVWIRKAAIGGVTWFEYDIGPPCDESKDEWLSWDAAKGRSFFLASGDSSEPEEIRGLGSPVEMLLFKGFPYFYSFTSTHQDKSGRRLQAGRQEVFLHKMLGTQNHVRACRFQFTK